MFTRICMQVGSSSYMTALFQVPLEAARALVPDDYFRVAEIFPDQAVFFVGTGEFRDCDIGPYKELYVGFYTENRENRENREKREPVTRESNLAEFSRNESKMYMWKNWVTTPAATAQMARAGSDIFRLGQVEREDHAHETVFAMQHESNGAIRCAVPRASDNTMRNFRMKRTHYGRLNGVPSRCMLDLEIQNMATSPGQGQLILEGQIAKECESLELPDRPLVGIWIDEMRFAMHKPLALEPGEG